MNRFVMAFFSLTILIINDIDARPIEPKRRVGQDWKEFQHQHCKWRVGHECKKVPENEGKLPPRTSEEIALEVGTGILTMGPTPQPKGFKVGIGAKPAVKPQIGAPKPSLRFSTTSERSPLLPPSPKPKPKVSGKLQRVNGKVGYLLGDTDPPTLGQEPQAKRIKLEDFNTGRSSTESELNTSTDIRVINRTESINNSDIEDAIDEIKNTYEDKTFENSELDIREEIENYNSSSACEKVSFREYYALRNYKESGYLEINKALRTGEISSDLKIEIDEVYNALNKNSDINIALRENGEIISEEESTVSQLYRGEVRNRDEFFAQIVANSVIEIDSFFSTTSDEEVIVEFNTDSLSDEQINVTYTIKYQQGRTNSTDLTKILDDTENERVFLPKSRFLIVRVEKSADGKSVEVKMFAISPENTSSTSSTLYTPAAS
ncbi:hypothetical protein [Yersinia alsatica]|uniref:hypothetical protein n=1 Tax=Yersinia alsatica TaxID=2890317 RepID=UPI0011A8D0B1|nr:hypothetical protein [Yersinia alsatica]